MLTVQYAYTGVSSNLCAPFFVGDSIDEYDCSCLRLHVYYCHMDFVINMAQNLARIGLSQFRRCNLNKILGVLLVIGAFVLMALYLTGEVASRKADMFYAQAMIIREQSQARVDLLNSMMPYTILGLGIIAGAIVTTVVALIVFVFLFVRVDRDGDYILRRVR